ncbi:isoprenoid biosynthesis protein ElbB [Rouxiella silvae]|jgi:enhancing lycopene biosynthesis protein 2|uniref:Glyoxalase n=1 Tax=Rouxiella silvae TaxID=1646373 RepID=A0ABX3U4S1_9GAMM|nr:isoprenoid biosynthesis glyoxalase ElbB [Rouxiella silvae]ORJ22455.1 isoprenoid biosynthesis protein ElbB [Rouxiella silvae]
MDTKKVAVILSGCGVYDGADVHEVVLTLLALESGQASYQCFAPDIAHHHVINHITGEISHQERNVLFESARIVRGEVKAITECHSRDFDAVIVLGGAGVAINLSDFAFKGPDVDINSPTLEVLNSFKNENKPAGYLSIAPVLLPLIYGEDVELTIGNDADTVAILESMGAVHRLASFDETVVDVKNNLVTSPAYMVATSLLEAKAGIDKLVKEVLSMSISRRSYFLHAVG